MKNGLRYNVTMYGLTKKKKREKLQVHLTVHRRMQTLKKIYYTAELG